MLRENVQSQRTALELEDCPLDLIAIEDNRVERVAVLHDRVRRLLDEVRTAADQPEERGLYTHPIVRGYRGILATVEGNAGGGLAARGVPEEAWLVARNACPWHIHGPRTDHRCGHRNDDPFSLTDRAAVEGIPVTVRRGAV